MGYVDMSGLSFLILFGSFGVLNYYLINLLLSDTFKNNKLSMAAASCLSAFVVIFISLCILIGLEKHPEEKSKHADEKENLASQNLTL